jgi:hypothetical protein
MRDPSVPSSSRGTPLSNSDGGVHPSSSSKGLHATAPVGASLLRPAPLMRFTRITKTPNVRRAVLVSPSPSSLSRVFTRVDLGVFRTSGGRQVLAHPLPAFHILGRRSRVWPQQPVPNTPAPAPRGRPREPPVGSAAACNVGRARFPANIPKDITATPHSGARLCAPPGRNPNVPPPPSPMSHQPG